MTTLYRKDRQWKIWHEGEELFFGGGVIGGAEVIHSKIVEPKSTRTLEAQILLETQSRINRQLDKGYSYIQGQPDTNQLGLTRPMLALPIEKAKNISLHNAVMQFKLDGNRCLLHGTAKETIAYSRQGKVLNIPHITNALHLPKGVTIDGELYCHGETLQTICSWIKRQQRDTERLKFIAYDYVSDESYLDRNRKLEDLLKGGPASVIVLPSTRYTSEEHLRSYFNHARKLGYEGAIVRLDGYGYDSGKRSKGLLKVKQWFDNDFEVFDIVPSSDNLAILDCDLFKVVCHGTHEYRAQVLQEKEKYIGKTVEVQYACLTKDGVPFHPVALRWKEAI